MVQEIKPLNLILVTVILVAALVIGRVVVKLLERLDRGTSSGYDDEEEL